MAAWLRTKNQKTQNANRQHNDVVNELKEIEVRKIAENVLCKG